MADSPLGVHSQGCLDEGQPAANERPVLIAGKDGSGNVAVPVLTGTGGFTVSTSPTTINWTDRSGTITLGGTAQQVMAANPSRKALVIENVSTGDLWISTVGTAQQQQPSIRLPIDASYDEGEGYVTTQAISIIGATAGQAFTAWEGQ